MIETPGRHAFAYPSPTSWTTWIATQPKLGMEPMVADWARAGRPLVVRRSARDDAAGLVPLGLPLPPSHGKRRIAIALAPEDILRVTPPPLLAEASVAAPPVWQATIARVLQLDPQTRVFGSLSWQHLTGLPYLSGTSDIDLLWQLQPGTDATTLLAGISNIDRNAPMRIDGEILGMAGGVQWRELQEDVNDVLVKAAAFVRSMPRVAFLAGAA